MRTLQQVLSMSTDRASLRSEAIGWSCEDPSCYEREPVGKNRSWNGIPPAYPHVLAALADGWRLLGPPTTYQSSADPATTWAEWWLVRDTVVVDKTSQEVRSNSSIQRSHCPKCGSSDIIDASQSLDCNACGHSW